MQFKSLPWLAEPRTPHWLPSGQVLRSHLIIRDRIMYTESSRLQP